MKKYIFFLIGLGFVSFFIFFPRVSIDDSLKESLMDSLKENVKDLGESIMADTIPNECLMLFDAKQASRLKHLSSIFNKSTYPVHTLEYEDLYDIVIFKENMDSLVSSLGSLMKINRPLKFNAINTRRYRLLEGFVSIRFAIGANELPLESIVMTMPNESKLREVVTDEKSLVYMIDNCDEFNFFYNKNDENPDISVEVSTQLLGKRKTKIGLILQQVDHTVFFLFILPKSGAAEPISGEFLTRMIK